MARHECPTCDTEFDTRRGLGVHHSQVHGERLPNRGCANCGVEFYSDYAKKYCSETCLRESVSFEGESNPNYGGRKEVTECEICRSEFEYYPSDKEGLYCPDCVECETWQTPPELNGSKNPRWKGGKVEVECAVCDVTVERYPSNFTGEVAFCGQECQREWLSESFTGEGHPNWEGGGAGPYGKGWNRVRKRALERDGHACVVCGKSKAEIGRNPDVHHITPVRAFVKAANHAKADAHHLENVASLCVDCHRKADFGKIPKQELRSLVGADSERG